MGAGSDEFEFAGGGVGSWDGLDDPDVDWCVFEVEWLESAANTFGDRPGNVTVAIGGGNRGDVVPRQDSPHTC